MSKGVSTAKRRQREDKKAVATRAGIIHQELPTKNFQLQMRKTKWHQRCIGLTACSHRVGAVNGGLCNRCPRQGVERPFYPPLFSFWRMVGWLMSRGGEARLPTIVRGEVKPSYSFRGEW